MRQESSHALDAGSVPVAATRVARAFSNALEAAELQEPSAAVDGVLAALHDGLDGSFVSLFLLEHGRLWLASMRGYAMIPDGLGLDEGIVGRAARTREIQLTFDVSSDPDFVPSARGVCSELAVPVLGESGVVGVLNVETTQALPPDAVDVAAPLQRALVGAVEGIRRTRSFDLSALARLFVFMGSLRDANEIAGVTARSLGRIVPLETCQLALREEGVGLADQAVWQASAEAPEPLPCSAVEALREQVDTAAVFELLDLSALRVPELVGSPARTVALVPLRANGEEIGVLVGSSRFPRVYDHRQAEAAALLGAHAAASIDAALLLSRERHSASTDGLTGLLNRRGFDDVLERELAGARDARAPLTVVVLDCDDLKEVNDRAGHDFGDALLREMGIVLGRVIGSGRTAARLGGDEFAVMIPGIDDGVRAEVDGLVAAARTGLADAGFPVTISGGLATYPYDGATGTELLRAADQALYEAKWAGKAQIIAFRDVVQRIGQVDVRPVERRAGPRLDGSVLADVFETAATVWSAESGGEVLERLARLLPFVLGSVGCVASRVDGEHIQEVASHALRDVGLGDAVTYLLDDFPLTKQVVESGESQAISFLDDEIDRAEAFVLRELGMSCCLLVPIVVDGAPWGLIEVYDQRHRQFSGSEQAIADFLVGHAARRIEVLTDREPRRRPLPIYRLPKH
jgi:diguanylate cyclase (GGDEF)-like protein